MSENLTDMEIEPEHKRTRPSFLPILGIQVVCIGLLSTIAFWSGWYSLRQADALQHSVSVEISRLRMILRQHARTVYGGGDLAESRASLQLLRSAVLQSAHAYAPQEQAAIVSEFDGLEAAMGAALDPVRAHSRDEALRRYDGHIEAVSAAVDMLEAATTHGVGDLRARGIQVILTAWAIAIAVYGCTGVWVRKRFLAREEEQQRDDGTIIRRLEAAVRGDTTGDLGEDMESDALAHALSALLDELSVSREKLATERHWARFRRDLVEALDLADTEAEILATAKNATEVVFPGSRLQVFLANGSQAQLSPQFRDAPPSCSPDSPHACPAIRRSRTMLNSPYMGLGRCPRLREMAERVVCAAISVRGHTVGALQVTGVADIPPPEETLSHMSHGVGSRLGIIRAITASELAAATDALTGLANRRAMNERLAKLTQSQTAFAIIAADLDHFKRINDSFGHEAGDHSLRMFAQILRTACRSRDLACRPGGEEFTAVLDGADLEGASRVAQRIHDGLATATHTAGLSFTVSLGIAVFPIHGTTVEEILKAADSALYAAKQGGRNCTRVFEEPSVRAASASAPDASADTSSCPAVEPPGQPISNPKHVASRPASEHASEADLTDQSKSEPRNAAIEVTRPETRKTA
ncbi:MAG TPA: GGDEF domain-containing protein [Anaeromyxobacteraceae bacterium]|nr:GGDEF domain-containing protein [Anaeromyxobacteraceae bacterium]